jgi:hypothetical protein
MKPLEMVRYDKKVISAPTFANLSAEEKAGIKSTRILPPRLGANDFGSIELTLKVPVYTA